MIVIDFPVIAADKPSEFIEELSKRIWNQINDFESAQSIEIYIVRAILDNKFSITKNHS